MTQDAFPTACNLEMTMNLKRGLLYLSLTMLCACDASTTAAPQDGPSSIADSLRATGTCTPVIEALRLAIEQPRLAQHEVDEPGETLRPPLMTRIGDDVWVDAGIGDIEHQSRGREEQAMVDRIAEAARAGSVTCERLGNDVVRGQASVRYRFFNPASPQTHNPWTLWVSEGSGLPVYHTVELHFPPFNGEPMSVLWVFGDGVQPPAPGKNQGLLDRMDGIVERLERPAGRDKSP